MAVRAQRPPRQRPFVFALLASALILGAAVTVASGEIEPASDVFPILGGGTTSGPARSIAALDGDRFVMVWPTVDQRIVARIFDTAGVPVSDEIDVDTGVPYIGFLGTPVVARSGDGFIVAWLEVGFRRVFARTFTADGTPLGEAVELFNYGAGYPNPDRLQVVGDGEGPMALVLLSSLFITGRWFDPQTGPLGDAFLIAQPPAGEFFVGSDAYLPGAGETLAVAWISIVPVSGFDTYRLRTQVFDGAGDELGPVQEVATVVGRTEGPALAPAPGDGYAVFWGRTVSGSPDALLARRFSAAGQPVGGSLELVAGGDDPIFQPAAAGDGHGNWLVAWNTAEDVEVQAFTADGLPLRSALAVGADLDQGILDSPALFPAAGDVRGRFTALWRQFYQCPFECPPPEFSTWGRHFTTGCLAGGDSLCLAAERFRVEVDWQDQHNGGSGAGNAVPLTGKSGAFWFFRSGNLELVTKVLDARSVNGFFWFFSGAMTEVGYAVTVTDTATGDHRTYRNEPGTFHSFADTAAFDDEPGGEDDSPAAAMGAGGADTRSAAFPLGLPTAAAFGPATSGVGPCPAAPQVLCLGDGDRFAVSADWIDPHNGGSGSGQGAPLTDDTGAFWFFNPANVELAVKILDGRPVNGHFWVFYASLTDVEFRLTVTDRETSDTAVFDNPPFHLASAGHTDVFGDE